MGFVIVIPRQVPGEVTMLAVTFMPDNPENNSQVQQYRRQEEFPRHLRIVYVQRTARRTMNRLFQNWRMARFQNFFDG